MDSTGSCLQVNFRQIVCGLSSSSSSLCFEIALVMNVKLVSYESHLGYQSMLACLLVLMLNVVS